MADLTTQEITESGLDATYATADAAGDTVTNDTTERTFVHVKNGSASQMTVTVTPEVTTKDVPGFGELTKSSISVDVDASGEQFIGPFPYDAYGSAPTVNYSDESSVTIAAIKV